MVFSSLIFLFFFLPAVLFCYYIVPQKFIRVRNAVLLLFSLFRLAFFLSIIQRKVQGIIIALFIVIINC